MTSENIYWDIQQDHHIKGQDAEVQKCCNHKKCIIMAVFLSGCILLTYRLIEYAIIILNAKDQQWINYNGKTYYFSTNKHTWDKADIFCKKESSNLTVIKKNEELNFMLDHTVGHTWVGLKRVNDKWKWIDGTAFHNKISRDGIQQMKPGYDCVSMLKGGMLLAAPCKTPNLWICERKSTV
ncbi:asialoglycoprotein receptor 2-like isoform X1 [Polypterus senegalus]|uniref:asialoglycoprotein receptor 2-like isoform X1 n=1 Tax=Polypterus senegalus TaxID=55291 RepID=UPI001965A845|nr:asialoglycoprotein receptor 2-like isoform X1 [Polypterus senegalus]